MTDAARPGRGGAQITIATAANTTSATLARDGMWDTLSPILWSHILRRDGRAVAMLARQLA